MNLTLFLTYFILSLSVPQRIISLAPSITEELFLLGAGDRIIGVTNFCLYPDDARKKEKIGTYLEPNLERIYQLKPDIIFVIKEGYRKETIDRLESLGLNVFVFDTPNDSKDIFRQFLTLGKIVGKTDEAQKILISIKGRIKMVKKNLAKINNRRTLRDRQKVFWQLGTNPLISVAKDTYLDELIYLSGGINIAHNSRIRYPYYNLEAVLKENPDAIILVTMGGAGYEELNFWKNFNTLKAVKNNRLHLFEASRVCIPSPATFVETLEELSKFLYGAR